jgi:chaperone modulatory protein CbpM
MTDTNEFAVRGILVEEEVQFTLVELSRACSADIEQLILLVREGVLTPTGVDPQSWRFGGSALRRARAALRLTRDLDLDAAGAALVLDLLDEIATLRARLRRLGED